MISISSPVRKLRPRIARNNNTSYLAETDGEVEAQSSLDNTEIRIISDINNPPTTVISRGHTGTSAAHSSFAAGITISVIKGNYWKVTGASTVLWLPEQ